MVVRRYPYVGPGGHGVSAQNETLPVSASQTGRVLLSVTLSQQAAPPTILRALH